MGGISIKTGGERWIHETTWRSGSVDGILPDGYISCILWKSEEKGLPTTRDGQGPEGIPRVMCRRFYFC